MPTVRYFVKDVDRSIEFYTECLGFKLQERMGPAIAMVEKDGLTLWLSGPISSAARPMPDGRSPEPGGWNRFVLTVNDFDAKVASMREKSVVFRNNPLSGPGGTQVLIEDPDGNPIEIFQPRENG
jgi:glyoxylase I family protein